MVENEYTGHVEPHGPSALRSFAALEIRKASVGPMDNNAYLLTCRDTGAQLLIDAAADADRLQALVAEGSGSRTGAGSAGRLDTIVTTHRHHDHVGALEELVSATGARTAAGAEDAPAIAVPTDVQLTHGDVLEVGRQRLEVIALRGHTPGSVALLWRGGEAGDHLFTGDSLFPGGVGNTENDSLRFFQLLDDVEERIFDVLPDATWVYPGHGDDTTLGAERPSLPQWRERGW
ncbi:MBL fold metallo-hydrolase [Brachybacterium sp. GCM10030267]|uniref:MBL fold metallo-hydrolase n=1 Tax=unclassified Brachybacterium TaxID=2623841 RepID=UPI003605DB98